MLYICLLVDRRRFDTAEKLLRELVEKHRHEAMFNFLLGLTLYLRYNNVGFGYNYFMLATKPKEFFRGVKSEKDALDKMQMFLQ